jgi:hypothetical protein
MGRFVWYHIVVELSCESEKTQNYCICSWHLSSYENASFETRNLISIFALVLTCTDTLDTRIRIPLPVADTTATLRPLHISHPSPFRWNVLPFPFLLLLWNLFSVFTPFSCFLLKCTAFLPPAFKSHSCLLFLDCCSFKLLRKTVYGFSCYLSSTCNVLGRGGADHRWHYLHYKYVVAFKALEAVKMSAMIFWFVAQCWLVGRYQRFGKNTVSIFRTKFTKRYNPED